MKTFLRLTAEKLIEKHHGDFSHLTVIFPNKRASLFLMNEFAAITSKPLWAPRFCSIDELFSSLSKKSVADSITAVTTLYDVYQQLLPDSERGKESLDQFWGWGEMLLSDFDDIDKHLVDAEKLFLNASQLNDLTDPNFLSEEQEATLRKFFNDFSVEKMTILKERFHALWNIMPLLYKGVKEAIGTGLLPYSGALMREVVESNETLSQISPDEQFAFVGFNMLGEVEEKLMRTLQKRGQASFFWDYDTMYLCNQKHEAGEFMRQNLQKFPNEITDKDEFCNLEKHPEITFISAPTDSIQTRFIPYWLPRNLRENKENQTAIVLCDENMLGNVLHSIPSKGEEGSPELLNITMGYSMSNTSVYSFIVALITLQTEGVNHKKQTLRKRFLDVVRNHPYAKHIESSVYEKIVDENNLAELLTYLDETICQDSLVEALHDQPLAELHRESIFQAHKTIQKFANLVCDTKRPLQLKPITFRRLLRRVLGAQSIPFHGEPAIGLQVMGVLETRCLDFHNLLILNTGEGLLPKGINENSMIPYNLRVAFGMTTAKHRVATFAYYFYRLIQRAESVTCVYNDTTSGIKKNEMSRFLRQLQAETDIPIKCLRLDASQDITTTSNEAAEKTPEIVAQLCSKYISTDSKKVRDLSPSAINTYLECPMKFYFQYVASLREENDEDDVIDNAKFGNIFHLAAKLMYSDIIKRTGNRTISKDQIGLLLADKGKRIQCYIDQAFKEEADIEEFTGENIIFREVVEQYLLNLLKTDQQLCPITFLKLEEECHFTIPIKTSEGEAYVNTGGIIDRMDLLPDGTTRIVDYKTGRSHTDDVAFEQLFGNEKKLPNRYYIQTLIYCLAVENDVKGPLKPALFYPGRVGSKDYNSSLSIDKEAIENFKTMPQKDAFYQKLQEKIGEIFNPKIPFCKNALACGNCPFVSICL